MAGRFEAPERRGPNPALLLVPLLVVILVSAFFVSKLFGKAVPEGETIATATPGISAEPLPTEATLPTVPDSPRVIATATLGAQGDLLMHRPIFTKGSYVNPDGTGFDFSSLFQYVTEETAAFDYFAANLETTLGGDAFPYRGNPSFNCPDDLLDALKDAGYDLLLTANNHSYDTLMTGINRTLEQAREAGFDTLGTRLSEEEDRYSIIEINGIRLGMVCYTYTMTTDQQGNPSLNNNAAVEKPEQINWFSYQNLNKFYSQMEEITAAMKEAGAEAAVLFIHWGKEYVMVENDTQRAIAQKMCDLGFDVIIGGHPHVVQPMDLLESTINPDHKTICIYSLGNAVSNQRREEMALKTGHTEDGVIFSVTFRKFSDGTVRVSDTDVLPTWVNLHSRNGGAEYNILPLDKDQEDQWQNAFGLTDAEFAECKNSYGRTMEILSPGLEKCRQWFG